MKRAPLLILFMMLIHQAIVAADASRSDTLDIRKTIINFEITDFSTKVIYAKASLLVKAKQNNISWMNFDLEGLTTDSVQLNGNNLTFTHNSPDLKVNLPAAINTNDSVWIDIYYHGIPIADATWGGFTFSGLYGFQMGVGFNAQPHSFGRTWHPCFDNFVERCPYEFFITTTGDKMAVCNGLLIDSTLLGNGNKIWHWKLDENIPSYLSSVAVCDYTLVKKILSGMNGNTDAYIACRPVDTNKVNGSFAHLQESFSMLEESFGPYLWSRVGYSLVPFNAGAMEHATNIHIGTPFIDGTLNYETLIAHELAHHWWGDLVTCSTAGDMWLNEGFASYCEMLHEEYTYGKAAYIKSVKDNHFRVLSTAHINDDGYKAISPMDSLHTYGTTVYLKGADMIHSMRSYLGDSLFFKGLSDFLDQYKWTAISSQQLRDFLSNAGGSNMQAFFSNWVFEPGFTHFSIDSNQSVFNGNSYDVSVFVRQRKHRSMNYYTKVPIEIGFYDAQMNLHIYRAEMNGQCLEFRVQLPFEPTLIVIDPQFKISDAVTEENKMIKTTGSTLFTQAKCRIYTKSIVNNSDSTFLQAEHHWVAPDRFKQNTSANGYVLNDSRYWRIGLINASNISGIVQFTYDAGPNNSYLDSTWIKNAEDSIRMFYRKDASEEWVLADDSVKIGALNDQLGNVYIKQIKAGEYCFGIKRSNYVDTLLSDAPQGPCAVVTSNPSSDIEIASFQIYPNPASGIIYIQHQGTENLQRIRWVDLQGRVLMESALELYGDTYQVKIPTQIQGTVFIQGWSQAGTRLFTEKISVK